MGTKNNPGEYDCYEKAEPDEPMFTLLARDWRFDGLVELWAALEVGHVDKATTALQVLVAEMGKRDVGDMSKARVAFRCATDGYVWREARELGDED